MTAPREDTVADPIAEAARAAAARLAGEHGPGVAAEVEVALAARGPAGGLASILTRSRLAV